MSTHAQEKAVLDVCLKFLSSIKLKDRATMHSLILPSAHVTNIRPPVIKTRPLPDLIDSLPLDAAQSIEENIAIWDKSDEENNDGDKYGGRKTEIRVDEKGSFAMAWTPYEVRYDGVVHHVGTNVFMMARRMEGMDVGAWVISGVADTGY